LLEGRRARFAGAYANGGLKWKNEDFAIANLARLARCLDRFHNPVGKASVNGDFNFDFGNETHGILSTAIKLCVAFLAPVAFDFSDRDTLDTECAKSLADLLKLEWFNYRNYIFHRYIPSNILPLHLKKRANLGFLLTSC
jgi:hypothetical protein